MVKTQPVAVSLDLGEGLICNAMFSWSLLQTFMDSIRTDNNSLFSQLLEYQFKMEMMIPQRSKEATKNLMDYLFHYQ